MKGGLSKYGYKTTDSAEKRRKSLKKACKKESPGTIIKRVNLISVFNRNKNPSLYKKLEADKKWMHNNLL